MARFRIRNAANNGWHDCVDTPMFIRTKEGDWTPLSPEKFSVRNQWGQRWHPIDDSFDPTYDDPCSNMETGACGGGPTSTTKGSGNGIGSGGREKYDILKGYPPGFDLPDAGRTGFGIVNSFAPPTGRSINRPGIKTIETYDHVGVASRSGLGTYANPNVPYASTHGRGATITETIYAMPAIEGYVEILIASYAPSGASVDVYHMGVRVASTCGKVVGRSRIKFQFDPDAADMRIMIRVRTTQGSGWSIEVYPPRLYAPSDRGGLALDSQASYDVINYPDVIHPDYIGTPLFPAPCHATVWPIAERIQSANAFEYYHFIGWAAGWMYLDYTSWESFDFIEVYQSGRRIATTLDAQTGLGYLYFYFDPQGVACDIMVRVVAKDFGNADSLASNYYSLYCPSERGARELRHPCESYSVSSAGHPTTEDNFALGTQTDIRAGLVVCTANSFDTKFEVFDQDMNLLDTEYVAAGRIGTLEFWKYPEHTRRANIVVRVTAPIGCDWSYFVYCPIQPPKFEVADHLVPYRCLSVDDISTSWTLSKGVVRYYGNVDHTVNFNFRICTNDGIRIVTSGYGRDITPRVASTGGYFQKTNETKHGDLWGTLEYEPWGTHIGSRTIVRASTSYTWTGSVYQTELVQVPTAANGWVGIITVYTPSSGEQYIDLRINVEVVYQ